MEDWEGGTLEESGKLDNPLYYCKHGTFIGDPYGPDYMCWACEEGLTDEEWAEHLKWEARRRRRRVWYDNYCQDALNKLRCGEVSIEDFEHKLHWIALISRRYRGRA